MNLQPSKNLNIFDRVELRRDYVCFFIEQLRNDAFHEKVYFYILLYIYKYIYYIIFTVNNKVVITEKLEIWI